MTFSVSKLALWGLWLAFLSYAFLLAPPDQPDTLVLIQNLSTGKVANVNPAIVALFNLMGIWPAIYGCLLFIDGHNQKIWAWPFAIGTFALGAFALLPYLALRQPNPEFSGSKNLWLKIQDSRWLGLLLGIATLGLLGYGLLNGNWSDFFQQWQTSRFIHVMSLDFCLLSLLFPVLLKDDMAKRGIKQTWVFWLVSLAPLLGPICYLTVRPALPATAAPSRSA